MFNILKEQIQALRYKINWFSIQFLDNKIRHCDGGIIDWRRKTHYLNEASQVFPVGFALFN